jgi:putative transposase
MRYRFIAQHAGEFEIRALCAALQVSRSGYYAWRKRPESAHQRTDRALLVEIRRLYTQSRGTYGSPRIHAALQAQGQSCGRKRVARLMRAAHLVGCPPPRPPRTTRTAPGEHPLPDLLQRDFTATAPNQKWVADITYIPTTAGWLYLAVVLDLFSRMVVGWAMLPQMTADLVISALQMAVSRRHPRVGTTLVHHSDHGSQYTSTRLQACLAHYHIQASMGRTGDCYDNAAMESFFATLKRECVHQHTFTSRAMARTTLFDFIEVFYNRMRRHSALGYRSPWEFEQLYQDTLPLS